MREFADIQPEPLRSWLIEAIDGPLWTSARKMLQKKIDTGTKPGKLKDEYETNLRTNILGMLWNTYTSDIAVDQMRKRNDAGRINEFDIADFCISMLCLKTIDKLMEMDTPRCQMPNALTPEQAICLMDELCKDDGFQFIPKDTDTESFLYLMGATTQKPEKLKPICWLQNKQLLRELLEELYCNYMFETTIKKAEMERLVPYCFVDKNGKEMKLAKNRKEPLYLSDVLGDILTKIAHL